MTQCLSTTLSEIFYETTYSFIVNWQLFLIKLISRESRRRTIPGTGPLSIFGCGGCFNQTLSIRNNLVTSQLNDLYLECKKMLKHCEQTNTGRRRAFTFQWGMRANHYHHALNIKCFEKTQMHAIHPVHENSFKSCLLCSRWKKNDACDYLHAYF